MNTTPTILLVDDEALIALAEARELEGEGYAVVIANSGREAMERISGSPGTFDLVLMDIDLGKGDDGTEIAREILRSRDLPIVFLSSHTEREIVDRTEKITSYGYVVKNSGITVLVASIRMAFKLHEANRNILAQKMEIEATNEELIATIEEMEAANQELIKTEAELIAREQALTESEEKNSALLTAIPDLIFIINREGMVLDWKGPKESLIPAPEEYIGRNLGEILPAAADLIMPRVGDLFSTGSIQTLEYDLKNGMETNTFEARLVLSGRDRVMAIVRDITQKKKAEEALVTSDALYQDLVDNQTAGIYRIRVNRSGAWSSPDNPPYAYEFVNDRYCELTGRTREEYRTDPRITLQMIHPDDYAGWAEENETANRLKRPFVWEGRMFIRGEPHWMHFESRPRELSGGVLVWTGILMDITERRSVEQALRDNESKYRGLFEKSSDAIFVADPETRKLVDCNRKAEETLGYSREEILSMTVDELHPEEVRARTLEYFQAFFEGSRSGAVESVLLTRDRIWIPVSINAARVVTGGKTIVIGIFRDITESKLAIEAMIQSENRVRSIIESLPAGIHLYRLESDGRLVFEGSNPAADRILGVDNSQFIGKTIEEAFPGLASTDVPGHYREVASDGVLWRTEQVEYHEGSIQGAFEVRAFRIGPGRMAAVFSDITERKKSEAALRQSEETLRRAQEIAHVTSWTYDIRNDLYTGSENGLRITGWKKRSFTFKNMLETVHPEDRNRIQEAWKKVLDGGPYEIEHRIVVEGQVKWIHVKAEAQRDSEGRVYKLTGFAQDITERRLADDALHESEERLRTLINALPDLVCLKDGEGRWLEGNRFSLKLFNLEGVDYRGKTDAELADFSEFYREAFLNFKASDEAAWKSGGIYRKDVDFLRRDGMRMILDVIKVPMFAPDGSRKGLIVVGRDITERKTMEEALERRLVGLTQPLGGMKDVTFEELFNLEEIQHIQDLFAKATGVASIITRTDGTPITRPSGFCRLCRDIIRQTEKGLANCYHSDAEIGRFHPEGPVVRPCLSGGLWDAGASISVGGQHIANWLIGQVRDNTQSEDMIRAYARQIGADEAAVVEAFREVPPMSKEKFSDVANGLFAFANQLSIMAYQNIQQARFITERKSIEEKLEKSLREKEILLTELQHRIKNNLGIISSLLSLEMGNLPDDQSRRVFQNAIQRIRSMSAIYEQLYRTSGLDLINMKQYVQDVAERLLETYALSPLKTKLVFDLDEIMLDLRRAVPLGLILNELLTNALKYAFPGDLGGSVRIALEKSGDMALLVISDDGIGLPADLLPGGAKTMGLKLVDLLVGQIEGDFSIEGLKGTTARVRFKIPTS